MCVLFFLVWSVLAVLLFPDKITIQFDLALSDSNYVVMEGYGDKNAGSAIFLNSMNQDYQGNYYTVLDFKDVYDTYLYVVGIGTRENGKAIDVGIDKIRLAIGNIPLFTITPDNWNEFSVLAWETEIDSDENEIFIRSDGRSYTTFGLEFDHQVFANRILAFCKCYIFLFFILFYIFSRRIENCVKLIKNLPGKIAGMLKVLLPYLIVSMVGMVVSYFLYKVIILTGLAIDISSWELTIWLMSISIVACFTKKRCQSVAVWMIMMGCIAVCLFFSVYKLTEYCTVDEPRAIREQYFLQTDSLRHWSMTESRTSYLSMGTFWTFLPSAIESKLALSVGQRAGQLAKTVFWFLGFIVVQVTIYFLYDKLLAKCFSGHYKLIVLTGCYLTLFNIPLLNMALKNYTYDMFAMTFGILGVVQLICFCVEKRQLYGALAIVALTLSVQEKILMSPVLLIALFSYAYVLSENNRRFCLNILYGLLISISVLLFTHWWVLGILRAGVHPISTLADMMGAPFLAIFMIMSKLKTSLIPSEFEIVIACVLLFGLCLLGKKVVDSFKKIYVKNFCWIDNIVRIFLLIWLCMGIVSGFLELPEGMGKYIEFILIHSREMVYALPSVLLVGVFIEILFVRNRICSVILIYCTYVNTVIYMFEPDRLWIKYSNAYVGLMCLCGFYGIIHYGYTLWQRIGKRQTKKLWAVTICLFLFTLSETVSSMPAYVYFTPYWNFSIYYKQSTNYGWGEYISVAGEKIEKYCRKNGIDINTVTMYRGYHGSWNNSTVAAIRPLDYVLGAGAVNLKDDDFVLIDNKVLNALNQVEEKDLKDLIPIDTIRYRGIPMVRIYTGEQIREVLASKGDENE